MFENKNIPDGSRAFDIQGTFQIHDTIYVLTDDADAALMGELAKREYHLTESDLGYAARKVYTVTGDEIMDKLLSSEGHSTTDPINFIISHEYLGRNKLSLAQPDIHQTIIGVTKHPSKLSWYNRPTDQFNDIAMARMHGFVVNMVDVPVKKWKKCRNYMASIHAADAIRYLAYWAARNSDMTSRRVAVDRYDGPCEVINPHHPFQIKKPLQRGYYL